MKVAFPFLFGCKQVRTDRSFPEQSYCSYRMSAGAVLNAVIVTLIPHCQWTGGGPEVVLVLARLIPSFN